MKTEDSTQSRRLGYRAKSAWLTSALLFLIGSGLIGLISGQDQFGDGQTRLARIDVEGTVLSSEPLVGLLGKAREQAEVKGVVLRINSPGGGVGAAQAVFEAVQQLAKEKPVAVSMGQLAASGGYMIALGGDRLFALDSTLTGSIGVIMMSANIQPLLEQIGIKPRIIKSGAFKDAGSPLRELRASDRAYLQSLLDELHAQFVTLVTQERGLPRGKVQKLADGRLFTGQKAKKAGLIDRLGGFQTAEAWLRKETGVGSKVPVKEIKPSRGWLQVLVPPEALVAWSAGIFPLQPRFLYMGPDT